MRRRLWLACAGLAIVSLAAAFALTRRGGQAVPPAAPGTITIDLPGSNRPWPLPAVDASPLNGAFASLGPSEIRTVRLSLARDADISFEGLIDVIVGVLTVHTATGAIEFLPNGHFRVKDARGREAASGTLMGPTGESNVVAICVHFPRGAATGGGGGYACCFGTANSARDAQGRSLELDATGRPLPHEFAGSRCLVTLKVSTSGDFEGKIHRWIAPRGL